MNVTSTKHSRLLEKIVISRALSKNAYIPVQTIHMIRSWKEHHDKMPPHQLYRSTPAITPFRCRNETRNTTIILVTFFCFFHLSWGNPPPPLSWGKASWPMPSPIPYTPIIWYTMAVTLRRSSEAPVVTCNTHKQTNTTEKQIQDWKCQHGEAIKARLQYQPKQPYCTAVFVPPLFFSLN